MRVFSLARASVMELVMMSSIASSRRHTTARRARLLFAASRAAPESWEKLDECNYHREID
jgi:hypothetical protein